MSKYQVYAKKVDTLAKTLFESYTRAEKRLEKATLQRKALDEHGTQREIVEADYEVASAKTALEFARMELEGVADELSEIRSTLVAAIDDEYAADPSQLDANTMDLLKSGILTAHEYRRIMDKAKADGNHTMFRMAGKYVADAANDVEQRFGADNSQARELREIGLLAEVAADNGQYILDSFDVLATTLETTAKNPAMIQDWESLTADVIESF